MATYRPVRELLTKAIHEIRVSRMLIYGDEICNTCMYHNACGLLKASGLYEPDKEAVGVLPVSHRASFNHDTKRRADQMSAPPGKKQ